MTAPSGRRPHVTLYTRAGCHLCEDAEVLLRRLTADTAELALVDVDGDAVLHDRYTVRVPVVVVDGREVAELVVDETAVRLALRAAGATV